LHERPAYIEARRQIGHWEIDTLLGAGSGAPCLVSAVERATGYVALAKLERPTATAFATRAIQLFQQQPHPVRTVTADNALHPVSSPHTERAEANAFATHWAWPQGATSPAVFHAARVPC
jgi:IS30 family transposase